MARLYAFIVVLSSLIAVVAVVGGRGGDASNLESPPPNSSLNLIAYVDPDGRVLTILPDGSSPTLISPEDGIFTWPIWSPTGDRIAYSGVRLNGDRRAPLALYTHDFEDGTQQLVYQNEPGMGPILPGMPHYPLWSNDGNRLAFMASVPQGLTLFLSDLEEDEEVEVVLRNSPLYASWSADSQFILVHSGARQFLVDVSGDLEVSDLDLDSVRFRAPEWSPSGSRIAFVADDSATNAELYIADKDGSSRISLGEVPGDAAFLWSPDGKWLAVSRTDDTGGPTEGFTYQGVVLYSPDGVRASVEIPETVMAYFWSPDSSMLAYITLVFGQGGTRALRWNILDIESGKRFPLVEFLPSRDQLTMLQFFDQFAHSHSLWSPNSKSLVFAGDLADQAFSASTRQTSTPQVFVVEATPAPFVERIAEGFLAVWSPR